MKNLSNQQIAQILAEYSIDVDGGSALVEGIQLYIELLLRWNRSISLTTVTDPEETVRFHFGECLFGASCVPITHGRLADVGTGAGFPGLPLKMLIRPLDVTLIESNTRKAAFLGEVVRKLGIDQVHIFRGRMEELSEEPALTPSSPFDFIAARALGQFDDLLTWSRAHLASAGKIILWLGQEDVASISQKAGWDWADPVQIPGSMGRFILWGVPRG
jgi:16S rRNA (guanine527-N7)-methyltransferase